MTNQGQSKGALDWALKYHALDFPVFPAKYHSKFLQLNGSVIKPKGQQKRKSPEKKDVLLGISKSELQELVSTIEINSNEIIPYSANGVETSDDFRNDTPATCLPQ